MAYTKIIVIHSRLDRCLGYTQDEEKTSLETVLDYAMNRDKTEQDCFENRPELQPGNSLCGHDGYQAPLGARPAANARAIM